MQNLLGYLTGRTTFVSKGWQATEIGSSKPVITGLRNYLGLDNADSDWRVASVMALLEQDQRIESKLPGFAPGIRGTSGRLNFMASLWQKPDDVWTPVGTTPAQTTKGPPMFACEPGFWPVSETWTITRVDDSTVSIRNLRREWTAPAYLNGTTLSVRWPEELGWFGNLTVSADWSRLVFTSVPLYPVQAVADGLAARNETPLALQEAGLYMAWNIAATAAEKISTVAAAIIIIASR